MHSWSVRGPDAPGNPLAWQGGRGQSCNEGGTPSTVLLDQPAVTHAHRPLRLDWKPLFLHDPLDVSGLLRQRLDPLARHLDDRPCFCCWTMPGGSLTCGTPCPTKCHGNLTQPGCPVERLGVHSALRETDEPFLRCMFALARDDGHAPSWFPWGKHTPPRCAIHGLCQQGKHRPGRCSDTTRRTTCGRLRFKQNSPEQKHSIWVIWVLRQTKSVASHRGPSLRSSWQMQKPGFSRTRDKAVGHARHRAGVDVVALGAELEIAGGDREVSQAQLPRRRGRSVQARQTGCQNGVSDRRWLRAASARSGRTLVMVCQREAPPLHACPDGWRIRHQSRGLTRPGHLPRSAA